MKTVDLNSQTPANTTASNVASACIAAGVLTALIPWVSGTNDKAVLLSAMAIFVLGGLIFCRRGSIHVFSGVCFGLAGLFCAYHLRELVLLGVDDLSLGALAAGLIFGGCAICTKLRRPWATALVVFLLFYGGSGVISKSLFAGNGICWVYEPSAGGGRLVTTEACFLVEDDRGILSLVPSGHLGIMPMRPDARLTGKKIGPYLIVGIVEMGGVIEGVDKGEYAFLVFSLVSPGSGEGGGAVVKNPVWPSV